MFVEIFSELRDFFSFKEFPLRCSELGFFPVLFIYLIFLFFLLFFSFFILIYLFLSAFNDWTKTWFKNK